MRKAYCITLLTLLIVSMAFAQGTPSSKATAAINTAVYCSITNAASTDMTMPAMTCHDVFSGSPTVVTNDGFAEIMKTKIKLSNSQSLFVSPSLVTGLYTDTTTKTRTNSTSTAKAEGGVYLRAVLKDSAGNEVAVGYPVAACTDETLGCVTNSVGKKGVVLDARVQTLSQTLSDCVVTTDGVQTGTCSFDSTIQLILQTTSAHTFNFVFPNVGVGTYTVSIQGAVNSAATIPIGSSGVAIGGAAFGLGSVTVESVRLIHDFDILSF